MKAISHLFSVSNGHVRNCLIPFLCVLFLSFPSFAQDFTAKNIGDYGNVTVMEASGNYDAKNPDATNNVVPRQIIAKEFFKTHKDEYDFLVVFSNFNFKMPESEARAFYSSIKNDVLGIGQQIFDNSALYGSNGHLQGTIDMGNIANNIFDPLDPGFEFTLDTLSHEMLHRWGAYIRFKNAVGKLDTALLGQDSAHWSYLLDTKGSLEYGSQWQDNGNGTFTSVAARKYYSSLDLYLMGMIDKSKVPPMLLIDNPAIDPTKLPELGATISGTPRYVTIDDIIAAEGERIPNTKDAQKQFKMAFIFVTTPGTFTGQELYGIENIRNGFLSRYSILTDGQGLVQVAATPKESLPVNPGVRPQATVPRTLPPNIEDGTKWLTAHQQTDGSWTDFALTTERDTAEAVTTLQRFAVAQPQFQAGLAWLGSSASANTDFLARRIEALTHSGGDCSALVQQLLSRRNPDGGWGSGRNFVSNPTDTALALKALALAGYSDRQIIDPAIAFLKMAQNGDGGWGGDTASTIQPTSAVVSAFNVYRKSYALDNNLNRAVAFLTGKQNPDGGFGNSPSTVYDSAQAVMVLQEAGADRGVINGGVNYLLSQQTGSGSWQESPYQTALAVSAVWQASVDPDLSIKADDITFIPDRVTSLPTNAVLKAVVWNLGRTDVAQAKVAVYDGGIASGKKVGEQILAFPGRSPATVTFAIPVTDGNEHVYNVVIDPDNLVKESNRNNNSAAKALLPLPTYDFEVLAADLAVSPNPVDMGQNVAITAKISNRGTLDAYSVPVRFFIDDPTAPVDIATVTIDIPAGGNVTRVVTWKANKAGMNLPLNVQADPLNAFAETSKVNNRAVVPLTVNGSTLPNLMVSYKDIVITPSPANQGGNAKISVQVKNGGFAPATNVKVNFYNGAPNRGGTLLGSQVLPAVNPGDSVTASADWLNIGESGGKIIYARVDPDNTIQEIAKDDNDAFTTLTVLSLPDLIISSSSILLTPAVPKDGDTVSIALTVQNTGDQDAANVGIRVNEGGTAIGTATIPLVKGRSQAIATIPYNAKGQTGSHSITVVVDPDNKILEQSKDNNTAAKAFGVQNANLWLSEPYFSPNGDGIKDTTQFSFRLNSPASVKVIVTDRKGDVVRTFSSGDLDNTQGSIVTWDGRNDGGLVVGDGTYQFKVVDANNTVLGSLPVVLDTNRSPISDAIGTKFSQKTNINCGLPPFDKWQWLPDESGILFSIEQGNAKYPRGLYLMGPNGNDIVSLTPREWSDNSDTLYSYDGFQNYKISPNGDKLTFFIFKRYNNRQVNSFADEEQLVLVDLTTNVMTVVESNYIFMQQKWWGEGYGYQPTSIQDYFYITNYEWLPDGNTMLYQKTLQSVDINNANNGQSTSWLFNVNTGTKSLVLTTPTQVKYFISPDEAKLVYTTSYVTYINHSTSYLGIVDLKHGVSTQIESNVPFGTLDNIIWSDNSDKFAYRVRSNTNGKNSYFIKVSDIIGSTTNVYSSETAGSLSQNHNIQWIANDKIILSEYEGVSLTLWISLNTTRVFLIDPNKNGTTIKLEEVNNNWERPFDGPYIAPNKQKIAYAVMEDDFTSKLKVSDLAGNVSILYSLRPNDSGNFYSELNSLTWSPDSKKTAFYAWGVGRNGASWGKVMIADIASGEMTALGAPVTLGWSRDYNALFQWQPDNLSFIGGRLIATSWFSRYVSGGWFQWYSYDLYDIYMFNTVTGDSVAFLNNGEYASKFAVSPFSRHLTYEVRLDPSDSCHPIYNYNYNDFNIKSISLLNNLTAELRVTKNNSALTLKGIAQDLNFEGYKLEYADTKNPDLWNLIVPPADVPVVNDVFATWIPPGNGGYYVRLTVWDKAGNTATSKKRVSWGTASSTITSLYKTTDFISPNGDGVKDTVELRYRILAPVHLEFNVYDEANNLVRTFIKDYASPVDDFISWDGRDTSGRVVPDGKYKIKILDYEFFVEVDTTAPKVSANIGRLLFDDKKKLFYADLSALVTDKNIKSWKIEYGEGDNPQEWHEYKTGSEILVNRDDKGSIVSPIQSALIQRHYDQNISWLKGKKFRVTAEDFAGNRSIVVTDFLEEKVILSKWDDLFTTEHIPADKALPGSHAVNGFTTLRLPMSSISLQYWNGQHWSNAMNATDLTSGMLNFSWDPSSSGVGAGYGVRVKMVDSLGGEHYSNVLATAAMFSVDSSCSLQLIGQNALFENLKLLRLQVQSSQDTNYPHWLDYKTYDAVKGDSIPIGEFSPPLPTIKPGLTYQIRMVGTGVSGQMYVSEPASYPLNCPVKISLDVTHDEAKGCDELSPGMVSLTAATINSPSNVSFKTLSYFIQKPEGSQLLRTFDILREGWKIFTLPTSGLPEGGYPVKAVLSYLDQADNRVKQADASATLKVDRVLPTSRITYPAGNSLKLCPIKASGPTGDWFGIPVESAVADNTGIKRYELYYGSGGNPAGWLPATAPALDHGAVVNRQIAGNGPIQGTIGTWNIAGLSGGTYSLKLKATDTNGNVSCATASVSYDDPVGIPIITTDKALISPNGDGIADDVRLNFQTDKYASVDAKVFKLLDNGGLDTSPLKVLISGKPYLAGSQSLVWDGKTDAGIPVSNGRYGMAVFATDSCGNTNKKWATVEVDNTPPNLAISYPKPADPLPPGNIIEVKGTVTDSHFQSYTLEAGQGDNPTTWATVAGGTSQVNSAILGVWNTFGLSGRWTLRLSAVDRVGNKSGTTSTIDLGTRKSLVKSLDVAPKLFSPNNDNKLDTSRINYEITDACQVKIEIVGADGTLVKSYAVNTASAGAASYLWDGKSNSGVIVADSAYQVKLTATLISNPLFTQTESLTLVVDTTPPLLDFKQPADKSFLNVTSLNVVGMISDQNLQSYSVSVTGVAGQVLNDSGDQNRVGYLFGTVKDIAEGDYTFTVQAKDLGENSTTLTRSFSIDRTPPKATLNTPKTGEYYGAGNNLINLSGSLIEKNLDRFSLRYGTGDAPAAWQELAGGNTVPVSPNFFSWKVGKNDGVPDGLYTISFYAKDKAGLEGEARVKVVVDNTPPAVAFASLHNGDYVKGPIDLIGDLKDANLDNGVLELAQGSCTVAAKWSPLRDFRVSVSGGVLESWKILPADGDYCMRLSAADKSGNKASTTVSVKIATHPPASPALSGKIDAKTNVILTWPRNSEADLAGYNVYRDRQKLNTALLADINYTDSSLSDGTYAYTVKAINQAGTESSASNAVKLRIDTIGPDARIISPQNGAKVNDLVNVKGTAFSSDDFKEYRLFTGQGQSPAAWNLIRKSPLPLSGSTLAQWDTTVLPDGLYSLKLEAEDLSGNVTVQTISAAVDNAPPAAPVLLSATVVGADVTITWRANTEADLAGYLLYRNDQLANGAGVVVRNLKPYLLTGTTYLDKAVPDGKYNYYLAALDQVGNMGNLSNSLTIAIDIRPPHAAITDPTINRKFEQNIMLKAESVDNDIASLQFQYKRAQESAWKNLGAPVTGRPFITYLDPKAFGLTYGDYQLMAVATDNGGKTDPAPAAITVTYTDLTPPAIPANLQAVTNGNTVTLSWSANTEQDLDGYNVYRTSGTASTKINATPVKTAAYQDANLSDGAYGYVVTAIDTFGNESKPSSSVSASVYAPFLTQPYTPVAQPAARITGANATPNSSVELFRQTTSDQTSLGKVAADPQGNFVFDNLVLAAGKNTLTAKATDSAGNVSRTSDAVVVVYGQPPAQPTGVAATVQDYSVSLAWNPNLEADLAGYNVYRDGVKLNGAQPEVTGTASASSDYYGWYPAGRAFDGNPATAWMSTYSYGTLTPSWWEVDFPSPELVNHMEIHWLNSYAGKDFEVQAWSGYVWITLKKVTGNTANDNAFDFKPSYPTAKIRISITDTNYPYYWKQVGISEVKILKDAPVSQTAYQAINLRDGKYLYTITAVNSSGFESPPSDKAPADVGDVTPPAAPQGLAATVTGSSVVLAWIPNSEPDLAGYNVYRNSSNGWQKLNTALVTSVSLSDLNLLNGTYTWHITAVDKVGNESDSSFDVTAIIAVTLPQPPGNLSATPLPEGKTFAIAWDGPGGSTAGYAVFRGISSGGPYQRVAAVPGTNLTYVDSGLVNGTVYYYVVTAKDATGNESTYSREVSGTPVDIVAPEKPLIFSPILRGGRVIIYRGSTDVAGTAEPGSTVELFKDNASVGKTFALQTATTQQVHADGPGNSAAPSPDGTHIVYTDYSSSALMIMGVSSGAAYKIAANGFNPVWSPDGEKIAYQYRDPAWNNRISIYAVKAKKAAPLTDVQGGSEEMPSWSGDGSKMAYNSNRGRSWNGIWIKDLVAATETQTSLSGNYTKLSPDGKKIAYFNDATLNVASLDDGTTLPIDYKTDGYTCTWSPDSGRVVFISYINGNPDLYAMELATKNVTRITASNDAKNSPAWSPDGQNIVYGMANSVWLTDLQGQNRKLADTGNLSALAWGTTGTIAFYDRSTKDIYTYHLPGQFVFKDVNLNPGENVFTAVATDDAGNTSRASDSISAVFDTTMLPDLSVSSDDIYIYPLFPKPGEDVTIDAVVTNESNTPVDNVDVDIYLWDSNGNLQLIGSQTIPHLNGKAGEDVAVNVNAGVNIGTQTIIVNVDPKNKIMEVLKSNNTATRELYVTDKEKVTVTATLDAAQYASGQDAIVTVAVKNSGSDRNGQLQMTIEDDSGNMVTSLASVTGAIPYGVKTYTHKWNTGATFAGTYRVHALFTATDGSVDESRVQFAILPDVSINSRVVTDKQEYGANENVALTLNLKNSGSNYIVPQLKVKVRTVNSVNTVLFDSEKDFRNLLQAMDTSSYSKWNTGFNAPGNYRFIVDGYLDGNLVFSNTAPFTVNPVSLVRGTILIAPAAVPAGTRFKTAFSVSNSGNISASGVVQAVIIDPDNGETVAKTQQPIDLPMNGSQSGEFGFSSQGLKLKTYQVHLRYVAQGNQKSIASVSVVVKDGTPPITVINTGSPKYAATNGSTYVTSASRFTLTATDDFSGVARIEYRINNGQWLPYDPFIISIEGSYTIGYRSIDNAGNVETEKTLSVTIDNTPPVSSATFGSSQYSANGNLYVSGNAGIILSASDNASGVRMSEYSIDGAPFAANSAPRTLAAYLEGSHTIAYRSTDNLGNQESAKQLTAILDKTPPKSAIAGSDPLVAGAVNTVSPVTSFTLSSSDNIAGVKGIWYRIDGGQWRLFTAGFTLTGIKEGSHTISFSAVDNVGNEEPEQTVTVRLIIFEVKKSISLDPLVLVGPRGDGDGEGDDEHRKKVKLDPLLTMLDAIGITYHAARDEKEFKLALRSGRFNIYLLRDDGKDEAEEEMREGIYYGDGFIHIKTRPDNNDDLSGIFGVKFTGKSTNRDLPLTLAESPLSKGETLQTTGKTAIAMVMSAVPSIYGTVADRKAQYPAIVYNKYGRGGVFLFTFDLLNLPDKTKAAELLANALNLVKPKERYLRAQDSVPVMINIANSTEPFGLEVDETIPVTGTVDTITPEGTQTANIITWRHYLEASEKAKFAYYLNLPDVKGEYTASTETRYANYGNYRLYDSHDLVLKIESCSAELLQGIITDLFALPVSDKKDKKRIAEAVSRLHQIRQTVVASEGAGENLEKITEAAKEVEKLSIDVKEVRIKIDELLKIWQRKWYLLKSAEQKERKDD